MFSTVENKKHNDRRKERLEKEETFRLNFADEMQGLLSLVGIGDYIQSVTIARDRVPCTILYTSRQIADIKALCFNRRTGSVLTFDKTYNLGSYT